MLAQWGERSPSERTVLGSNPGRPRKTYTVICLLECPYKMYYFRDDSVYLCIQIKVTMNPLKTKYVYNVLCVNGTYVWVCVLSDIHYLCACDVILN